MEKFEHGGNIFSLANTLGIAPYEILDFSANINPLGPPLCVKKALFDASEQLIHYPPSAESSIIKEASEFYKVDPQEIVFGNGSTELLYLLPKVLKLDRAVILAPCYVDYEKICRLNHIEVKFVYLREQNNFVLDSIDTIKMALDKSSIVFIGQPNNPTGTIIDPQKIRELATDNPDSIFIIDEAFADFVPGLPRMYENRPKNVVVLLSLTKFYAIPGLRLGLLIGEKSLVKSIREHLPPWSINIISIIAAQKIFQDKKYIKNSQRYISWAREKLFNELESIPEITPFESKTNFILCKINIDKDAKHLKEKLIKKNIIIRDCSNYRGLDTRFFRIAVKKHKQNIYLIDSLKQILGTSGKNIVNTTSMFNRPKTHVSTPAIMFVGTSSNAGKSILAAGLCRILLQDGYRVAPFKAQNMSLNSYVTIHGGEMGRAQVLQSQACKLEPDCRMNPVLLKPSSDTGSQVIVLGRPVGNMKVGDYIEFKKKLLQTIRDTYDSLAREFDVMVIEGAGSPAEINLKSHDITNMEMARYARANTFIVGDIDRGGVFASFIGTIQVMDQWERDLIKGVIINKFRGDKSLLDPAIKYTQDITGKPCIGIIPFIKDLSLPEEDSVSFKSNWDKIKQKENAPIKIACIDLPHISNFTDLDPFLIEPDVNIEIIKRPEELKNNIFDAIIIPGSKNVIKDNEYLIKTKIADVLKEIAHKKISQIIGICGGFQIIGKGIHDPHNIESQQKNTNGLGLIPTTSELKKQKTLIQCTGIHIPSGLRLKGYEIHHGKTICEDTDDIICIVKNHTGEPIGYGTKDLRVWGSYLHGIFDQDEFRRWFIDHLREKKGLRPIKNIVASYDVENGLDRLADIMRENINMDEIYRLIDNKLKF